MSTVLDKLESKTERRYWSKYRALLKNGYSRKDAARIAKKYSDTIPAVSLSSLLSSGTDDGGSAGESERYTLYYLGDEGHYPGSTNIHSRVLSLDDYCIGSPIQIMKIGKFDHPVYGVFEIDSGVMERVVENFNNKVLGIDICVDVNHEPNHEAVGWFKRVYVQSNALLAAIDWNEEGVCLIKDRAYRYFSPEWGDWKNPETGDIHKDVLFGGAITNRPFLKSMQPLSLSDSISTDVQGKYNLPSPFADIFPWLPEEDISNESFSGGCPACGYSSKNSASYNIGISCPFCWNVWS
jgi:hypothetical protein